MSKDTRYYTPSIEEFHVGFEYEFKLYGKDEWNSTVYDLTEDIEGFKSELEDEECRVKYLDKEDLESLGGIKKGLEYRFKHSKYRQFFAIWFYDDRENNILIRRKILRDGEKYTDRDAGFNEQRVFHGNIKNKSELKRLLKQLGI